MEQVKPDGSDIQNPEQDMESPYRELLAISRISAAISGMWDLEAILKVALDNVLDITMLQSSFDRALVKCEDSKDRLSRIRSETKQFSLKSPTAPNGAVMSARLEVPRRDQDGASHPCPNSTLQENGYLSIQ